MLSGESYVGSESLCLSTGRECSLSRPSIPGLHRYYVLALPSTPQSAKEAGEFHLLAHRVAEKLAEGHYGDKECYALMYSAGRTRRRAWPHVHIVVARSVAERRRSVLLLQLKHLLWWRRWPNQIGAEFARLGQPRLKAWSRS